LPRPKRGATLDPNDWRFLESIHARDGVATWSQLKKEEHFGQALISSQERRLLPQGLLQIRREGRKKLFVITDAAEKRLSERHSPESRESAEFVVEGGKSRVKITLDAYMQTLSHPEIIKKFYSSPFARSMALYAFNLLRELHMRDGKPVRRGPVVAELRIRADFSDIPPFTKWIRFWRNEPSFPPEGIAEWIETLYSLMTTSTNIQEVIKTFERVAVKKRLSDQIILLGFSKLRSLWEIGIWDRDKLRTRLTKLQRRSPDRAEVRAWLLFFDVLNTSYLRLNRELTPERFSKKTFWISDAYAQAEREYPKVKDLESLLTMLNEWKENVLQTVPPP